MLKILDWREGVSVVSWSSAIIFALWRSYSHSVILTLYFGVWLTFLLLSWIIQDAVITSPIYSLASCVPWH